MSLASNILSHNYVLSQQKNYLVRNEIFLYRHDYSAEWYTRYLESLKYEIHRINHNKHLTTSQMYTQLD